MSRAVSTVVTYLRADGPPAYMPPQPMGFHLALMRAESCPLHFYRYLYATVGRDYVWVNRLALSDETLAEAIHAEGIEISVLYGNGVPAGFFELDFRKPETVDLAYFGLMPEWTGCKIGPWLLATAMAEGFSRGAEAMTVNTCTMDHPAALSLYQRLGFTPVGRAEHDLVLPDDYEPPAGVTPRHLTAAS